MNRFNLAVNALWLKAFTNGKPYNLDSFLSVESYVKKLIIHMYENQFKDQKTYGSYGFINKSLVELLETGEPIELPKLRSNVKVNSIVIEGNDVSGKETFSKHLENEFCEKIDIEVVKDGITKHEVHLVSFPNYDGPIGRTIASLLRTKRNKNFDDYILNWLFCYDRINTMFNYFEEFNERRLFDHYHHVFIFDRFFESNWVYNQKTINDPVVKWLLNTERRIFSPTNRTHLILFHRDASPDLVHDKLIESKKNKDANETIAFQEKIRQRFLNPLFTRLIRDSNYYIYPIIHKFTVKDVVVDNKPYEKEFINLLFRFSKLGDNNLWK